MLRNGDMPGASTLSIRTAAALNSAVPDFGSVASIVKMLVSTSSGKWNVMNTSPGRSAGSIRTGASSEPRRDVTRTVSPATNPCDAGILGRHVDRFAPAQRAAEAADCTPVL